MSVKSKFPEAPAWLDDDARAEWVRVGALKLVAWHPAKLAVLAGYCQSFSRYKQAEGRLTADGTEIVIRTENGDVEKVISSPHVAISNKNLDRMILLAGKLGLHLEPVHAGANARETSPAQRAGSDLAGLLQ